MSVCTFVGDCVSLVVAAGVGKSVGSLVDS